MNKFIQKISFGIATGAILATSIVGTSLAAGKSAPKATGSIGYTAGGLQRYAEFNAIQASNACSTAVNLTGSYVFTLTYGGTYAHDIVLTQSGAALTGTGGYPSGGSYSVSETISGTVTGNTFTFTSDYGNGYAFTVNGVVNSNGTLAVSSWTGTGGQSGPGSDWTVTGNASTVYTGCTGKGTFNYSDANGTFYTVDVQYVKVSGDKTWFAGPVVSGNAGAGQWLFAEVQDGGEPGINVDKIWGSFTTEAAAKNGVALMTNPSDGAFTITSGNIQVH